MSGWSRHDEANNNPGRLGQRRALMNSASPKDGEHAKMGADPGSKSCQLSLTGLETLALRSLARSRAVLPTLRGRVDGAARLCHDAR